MTFHSLNWKDYKSFKAIKKQIIDNNQVLLLTSAETVPRETQHIFIVIQLNPKVKLSFMAWFQQQWRCGIYTLCYIYYLIPTIIPNCQTIALGSRLKEPGVALPLYAKQYRLHKVIMLELNKMRLIRIVQEQATSSLKPWALPHDKLTLLGVALMWWGKGFISHFAMITSHCYSKLLTLALQSIWEYTGPNCYCKSGRRTNETLVIK